MNAKRVQETIAKEAFQLGRQEAWRQWQGPLNDQGRNGDMRRMLYNIYEGIFDINTDEPTEYRMIWQFIDENFDAGYKQGKKEIADENRTNKQRIARMDAERELKKTGFGL